VFTTAVTRKIIELNPTSTTEIAVAIAVVRFGPRTAMPQSRSAIELELKRGDPADCLLPQSKARKARQHYEKVMKRLLSSRKGSQRVPLREHVAWIPFAGTDSSLNVPPRQGDRTVVNCQTMSTVEPTVLRDSKSRCACAASFSG
jgi:hypothetical protein